MILTFIGMIFILIGIILNAILKNWVALAWSVIALIWCFALFCKEASE